jgi:hypothetical protein
MNRIQLLTAINLMLILALGFLVIGNINELFIIILILLPVLTILSFNILILGMKKTGTTSLILLAIIFVIFLKNSIQYFIK